MGNSEKIHMMFPPGRIIVREMDERDWSLDDLVEKSGIDWWTLYYVIYMCEPITGEIAVKLHDTFGTSVTFWLNLERNFQEWLAAKGVKKK